MEKASSTKVRKQGLLKPNNIVTVPTAPGIEFFKW